MSNNKHRKADGDTVPCLSESLCSDKSVDCFRPDIRVDEAFAELDKHRRSMSRYMEVMRLVRERNVAEDQEFRRYYAGFYRLRRDSHWRDGYFQLMESCKCRQDISFGGLLLRLFEETGRIEASFTSKMLASLDPDMPIWDSMVLKSLHLKLKGNSPQIRLSNAVVLYEMICDWYKAFLKTEDAKELIERFDRSFPEYQMISRTKKIDFILWANR